MIPLHDVNEKLRKQIYCDLLYYNRREISIPLIEHPVLGGPPTFDSCTMYDVDYDEVLRNNLRPNTTWPTVPCSGHKWDYDIEQIHYPSIVTEVTISANFSDNNMEICFSYSSSKVKRHVKWRSQKV